MGASVPRPGPAARPRLPDQPHHAAVGVTVRNNRLHRAPRDFPSRTAPRGTPGAAPGDRRELWVVDSTLIPVHDHTHTHTAKSKNYRHSVNVQVVCRARDRRIAALGDAWPGNRNDIVVFRETLGRTLPAHPRLAGDGGYRGCAHIRTPRRGPDGRIIKDRTYKRFRKRRAVAEHTIARLKDHQILRQCRRRGDAINH
ncbi:transposase [Streptomyces sp. CA-106131]|uniref:transposase n=1 Tax=Streptomyces sp. CA-106131 TaxID=3240045 RepID=UPI003D9296E4